MLELISFIVITVLTMALGTNNSKNTLLCYLVAQALMFGFLVPVTGNLVNLVFVVIFTMLAALVKVYVKGDK